MSAKRAGRTMSELRAELFRDVQAYVEGTLRDLGIDHDRANHCGHAVADALAVEWRGQTVCVPTDYAYRMSERENAIMRDLRERGLSKAEIVLRYSISLRGVYKLIERCTRRDAEEDKQSDLFGTAEPST